MELARGQETELPQALKWQLVRPDEEYDAATVARGRVRSHAGPRRRARRAPCPCPRSRTMKGGGAAGVATVGAAGVEVAQQAVAATQSAVQPLIPYLDTLRWLFIAMALIGVSVTIYARWDDWQKGRR